MRLDRLGQPVVRLAGLGLLGGEVLAHLLGCLFGRGAHLVGGCRAALGVGALGIRGSRALLGCGPSRFHLGLGRGRVAERRPGSGQPLGDVGERAR